MARVRRAVAGAALALAFLTVAPLPVRERPEGIGAAAAWFPAVGALVGLVAAGVRVAADPTLGAGVAAVLATAVMVALTGALHQDGLADCADGLGVRGDRARRLAVMREPSIGAFGTMALVLWALLFAAALGALPRGDAVRTLVVVGALGRWGAVLHAALAAPARPQGLACCRHRHSPRRSARLEPGRGAERARCSNPRDARDDRLGAPRGRRAHGRHARRDRGDRRARSAARPARLRPQLSAAPAPATLLRGPSGR